MSKLYDIVIDGAGIIGGCDTLAATFTGARSIAVIEQYSMPAQVNSKSTHNSQTIHEGDIETNYDESQCIKVKHDSAPLVDYVKRHGTEDMHEQYSKMVIGVGSQEVEDLEDRFEWLQHIYPHLKLIHGSEIAKYEPKVMEGRDPLEAICALQSDEGHAVDFWKVTESVLDRARARAQDNGQVLDEYFGTKTLGMEKDERTGHYRIFTENGTIEAKTVIASMGAHSLMFAKSLGYGENLGVMPVGGDFFLIPADFANGKIYTKQDPKRPFAAPHADNDLVYLCTRLGPTAIPLFVLERGKLSTFADFLRTNNDPRVALAYGKLFIDNFDFAIKNMRYGMGERGIDLFMPNIQKIFPTIRREDVRRAPEKGGLRPQLINLETLDLYKGEARIVSPNGDAVFNITPSPGASVCMSVGARDADTVAKALGTQFDREAYFKDIKEGPRLKKIKRQGCFGFVWE
jgi:L-2-hydroxyglutarate oxidase LhgO